MAGEAGALEAILVEPLGQILDQRDGVCYQHSLLMVTSPSISFKEALTPSVSIHLFKTSSHFSEICRDNRAIKL